ncbi:MAG: hypothetical protein E7629_07760 [Ruminococcaceae bacterium]|nr:hypothetical protein [Oscillospiraceae bacterium]
MKKPLSILLALLLGLSLVSCIQAPQPAAVSLESQETETDPPVKPSIPKDFSDPKTIALDFLENRSSTIVDCSEREYSYAEMEADLGELAALYPDLFSYRSFGKSVAGRELYVGILGNPNAKKQVLVSAGLHGREYLTPLLVMKQLEFYLTYYDVGHYSRIPYATLFEEVCFYVIPMNNPDGIMLSQEGIGSLTDPTLRATVEAIYYSDLSAGLTSQTNINKYLQYWKANARGVDLNRNFDALWEEYFNYSLPSFAQYKGPSAASEPETRATVALIEGLSNLVSVLCIHSQGEVLYWNCGQAPTLLDTTLDFTEALAERSGYKIVEEQNNDASLSDWCALKKGLIAVTIETGLGLCPLDLDKFEPIWNDHFDLLPLTAVYFRD